MIYKQDRGYDSNRIFELKVPKFYKHYIKEGFIPTSSHPEKSDDGTITYERKYAAWHRTNGGPWVDVCVNSCALNVSGTADASTGVLLDSTDDWDPDTMRFFTNKAAIITVTNPPEEWKFSFYPYRVPPSEKKDTAWEATFKVNRIDSSSSLVQYNSYIVKEFVKPF